MILTMVCDHCKTQIERGAPYSITEYGRLHAACQRQLAADKPYVRGKLGLDGVRLDPVFVLQRR